MRNVRVALSVSLIGILGAFAAAPGATAGDRDCSDFQNWHQAQRFYKHHQLGLDEMPG